MARHSGTGKYRHFSRAERVADQIQRDVGNLLITGISDPRIGFVSVVKVKVSPDLGQAKIYMSVMGDSGRKEEAMKGLTAAAGFIQHEVGSSLGLRTTPRFVFFLDESMDHADRINALLEGLKQ